MIEVMLKPKGPLSLSMTGGPVPILLRQGESAMISTKVFSRYEMHLNRIDRVFSILSVPELSVYTIDGIGDIHWLFTKLGSLKLKCRASFLTLHVRDLTPARPRRCQEFVALNGDVDKLRFKKLVTALPEEGYFMPLEGGIQYYLDPTSHLASDKPLASWLPELDYDDQYPHKYKFTGNVDRNSVVVYVGNEIMERNWYSQWKVDSWALLVWKLVRAGYKVLMVGLGCDQEYTDKVFEASCALSGTKSHKIRNLCGGTSFIQVIDTISSGAGIIGACSGLTIFSAFLGIPTTILWAASDAIHPLADAFRYAGINPSNPYLPLTFDESVAEVLNQSLQLLKRRKVG